jgi:branched-subunit amino acid transport protein AzlD
MHLHLTQVINQVPLVRKMMNLSRLTIILVFFKRTPPYTSLSLKNPLELIRSFQNHLKMKVFKEKNWEEDQRSTSMKISHVKWKSEKFIGVCIKYSYMVQKWWGDYFEAFDKRREKYQWSNLLGLTMRFQNMILSTVGTFFWVCLIKLYRRYVKTKRV